MICKLLVYNIYKIYRYIVKGKKERYSYILIMNIFELKFCIFNREIFVFVLFVLFLFIVCGKI